MEWPRNSLVGYLALKVVSSDAQYLQSYQQPRVVLQNGRPLLSSTLHYAFIIRAAYSFGEQVRHC